MGKTNDYIIKAVYAGLVNGEPPEKPLPKREARRRVEELMELYNEVNRNREENDIVNLDRIIEEMKLDENDELKEIKAKLRFEKGVIIEPLINSI